MTVVMGGGHAVFSQFVAGDDLIDPCKGSLLRVSDIGTLFMEHFTEGDCQLPPFFHLILFSQMNGGYDGD